MSLLADLITAARMLVEAEVCRQRRKIRRRVLTALVLCATVAALVMVGLGLVVWGAYLAARCALGPAGGAFLVGGISLLLGAGTVLVVHLSER